METYRIITDSCCDLTQELADELNVMFVPLYVNFKGASYPNMLDESGLNTKEFYDALRAGEMATTNAVNPSQWKDAAEAVLKNGQDVLILAFSSGLSTTYNSACIAAEELMEEYPDRKVYVVDTLCGALGQGMMCWYVAKKQQSGASLEEARDYAEQIKLNMAHWFTVNDLFHLKRGGRVSAATAVVGTMLQIKPVLHVDDEGHLIAVSKARGRKGSLEALAAKVGEDAIEPEKQTMFISHGDCLSDAMIVGSILKERYGVQDVKYNYVGPVIGSHAGPGVVALFYFGKKR